MSNASEATSPTTASRTVLVVDAGDARPQWQPRPEPLSDDLSWLEGALNDTAAAHRGTRLIEQELGGRLVVSFGDVTDAITCAIALQLAQSPPIRLRIAVHGLADVPAGATSRSLVNRAGRLCDLAHGGQTVLSETTHNLIADRLPPQVRLLDLGTHRLRGLPYPERVTQLCHPELAADFPPLLTVKSAPEPQFPRPLTSFVGRETELTQLRRLVPGSRLVTLTGTGGVGKTRLALQLADDLADQYRDGAWWVDLAPITDPELLPERITHAVGLPDRPDLGPAESPARFLADRHMLLVLDNCEHLLDACAELTTTLLAAGAELTIVATSREPLGVAGEVTWATPSLSLADEARELFRERARLARPGFTDTDDAAAALVTEICQRLDGVPLAIELAATRVRALSLKEIASGLRERFDLLTGGARTAVPRQQTLRASEDWSHDLLSETERVVFRRLAPFLAGFDLNAAHAVAGGSDLTRSQIIDRLAQLVDKSLLVADNTRPTTRFAMLQTVQQYALEKLEQSGESETIHARHRDHYLALFGSMVTTGYGWNIEQADLDIANLRAAFTWSLERGDVELAGRLASSLFPLWVHSRTLEGVAWFKAVVSAAETMSPAAHARALADKTIVEALAGKYGQITQAEQALSLARGLDDPALLAWSLAAYGFTCTYSPELALSYFDQAIELSPALKDNWRLSQIYGVQAYSALVAGDLATTRAAAEAGRALAEGVGDWSVSRLCRLCLSLNHLHRGQLTRAEELVREVAIEAEAARDPLFSGLSLSVLAEVLACRRDVDGALAAAEACVEAAAELMEFNRAVSFGSVVDALLAAGDISGALDASWAALDASDLPQVLAINGNPVARAALASGDVAAARHWTERALLAGAGFQRVLLLEVRARIAIAEGDHEQAAHDARDGLATAAETGAHLVVPDLIESLATLAGAAGQHHRAVRMFGSASAVRERTGVHRFKVYDADYTAAVDHLRDTLEQNEFERLWEEGSGWSTAEAIAYASRDSAERRRPPNGWEALTPAEHNVIRLVSAGLRDKDIATKLSISPRTVHSHLNHIYAKLDISSRLQLAQEAARHM